MQTLAIEASAVLTGMIPAKPQCAGGLFADFLVQKGIQWAGGNSAPDDKESEFPEASPATPFAPPVEANPLSILIKPGSPISLLPATPDSIPCSIAMTPESPSGSGGTLAPSEQAAVQFSAGPVENSPPSPQTGPRESPFHLDLFGGESSVQNVDTAPDPNGEFIQQNQVESAIALESEQPLRSPGLPPAPSGREPAPPVETLPTLESSQPEAALSSRPHLTTGIPGERPQVETASAQFPDSSGESPAPQSNTTSGNETSPPVLKAVKTVEPGVLTELLSGTKAGEPSSLENSTPAVEGLASTGLQVQTALPLQAAASQASPYPAVIEEAMVVEQMVQNVRLLAGRDGGTIRMSLEPPELGTVRIRLELSEDRARGWIEASSRSTQELLEHNAIHLRRSLENHGIHLESFVIRSETQDTSHPRYYSPGSSPDGQTRDWSSANPEAATQDAQSVETTAVTPGELTFLLGNPLWGWDLFA